MAARSPHLRLASGDERTTATCVTAGLLGRFERGSAFNQLTQRTIFVQAVSIEGRRRGREGTTCGGCPAATQQPRELFRYGETRGLAVRLDSDQARSESQASCCRGATNYSFGMLSVGTRNFHRCDRRSSAACRSAQLMSLCYGLAAACSTVRTWSAATSETVCVSRAAPGQRMTSFSTRECEPSPNVTGNSICDW